MIANVPKKKDKSLPLGEILQAAGLLSAAQIEVAIYEQSLYPNLKIGEIFALRNWLKQETADFFAEKWFYLVKEQQKKNLGYYLQQAGLLNEQEVQHLLAFQKQQVVWLRLGQLAVDHGYLHGQTLDFLLEELSLKASINKIYRGKKARGEKLSARDQLVAGAIPSDRDNVAAGIIPSKAKAVFSGFSEE